MMIIQKNINDINLFILILFCWQNIHVNKILEYVFFNGFQAFSYSGCIILLQYVGLNRKLKFLVDVND